MYKLIIKATISTIHIGCDQGDSECYEKRVDIYLNEYCANATVTQCSTTISRSTVTVTVTRSQIQTTQHLQEMANSIDTTVTSVNSSDSTTVAKISISSTATVTVTKPTMMVPIVLGAMLGLSLLTLAMVTAGWMWTCWRMKRGRNVKSLRSNTWTRR